MKYSITPLTKLLRENNIPTSPLVKSKDSWGAQTWVQTKDGYSYSKSRGSANVWFYVKGDDVLVKMKEVIESEGYKVDYYSPNGHDGGEMSVDLKQFYNNN